MTTGVKPIYRFADFTLDPSERRLLHGEHEVYLPPKTFDMLLYLVERHGHLVKKDELLDGLWADTFVTEGALTQRIKEVRETLGDDAHEPHYIKTIPRMGYKFIAEVEVITEAVCAEELEEEFIVMRVVETEQGEETGAGDEVSEARRRPALAVEHVPARLSARITPRRPPRMLHVALAAGVVLAGLILLAYSLWPKPPQPAMPIKSLAVLPFKPLAADSRDESFELGMADSLILKLSDLRQVTVRPLSAVRRYTALEQDAVAAGRELQVETVLDGSIQQAGERIRARVRLLRVRDEATLWIYQCDEYCADIFAAQDAISEKVARALAIELTGQERELLAKRYTASAPAYQAYVRGRYFLDKRTYASLQQAIEYFKEAIAIDPHYALAYAGLADTYNTLGGRGFLPQKEVSPRAREMATKALELDDKLAEAHGSLACALADYYWNWPEAEKHLQRAIAINPNHAHAHELYSEYLSYVGRHEEAIAEAERAHALDPASSSSVWRLGISYNFAGQYDRALEQFRRTLELNPNFHPAHFNLGLVYKEQKRYEEALAELRQARASGMNNALAVTGYVYAVSGRRREAQQVLDELNELSKREHVTAFQRAYIYAGLDDKDRAFEWLEKAYIDREWYLLLLKEERAFERLRSDPRFQDLLRRVGLTP